MKAIPLVMDFMSLDFSHPICFSSLGCPSLNVETLCQLAQAHGIHRLEIRSLENQVDYPSYLAADPHRLETAKKTFAAHQIDIALIGSSLNLTQGGPEQIAPLLNSCRVADFLSAPYVRLFGGGSKDKPMSSDQIKQAANLYKMALTRSREAGISSTLLVETHGGLVTADLVLQLCHEVGEAVPILWDTHHTWKLGGEALGVTHEKISHLMHHFHCKDSTPIPSPYGTYTYALPGEGNFPFRELFDLLRRKPLPGCLSLEWEKQWHPELPELDLALKGWTAIAQEFR